jgi:hypothetical protein
MIAFVKYLFDAGMSLIKSLAGYTRLVPAVFTSVFLIVSIGIVSVLIAFPFWYISTNFASLYTGIVCAIIAVACISFIIKKLVTERLFGKLVKFIGLVFELILILFLYYKKTFYYVPAIVLSVEYLFFLGISMRIDGFLSPWMSITLLVSAFFGYLYSMLVLFAGHLYFLCIPLSLFYLFSFGRLIIEKKRPRKKEYDIPATV